jgi:hypothetical protein
VIKPVTYLGNALRGIVEKPNGWRSPKRCMHRGEDSIRVYLEDTGWKGMDGRSQGKNRDQQ